MHRAYFDDSGTHGGSKVVVWAGLVGSVSDFAGLEARWKAILADPMPGKKPLPRFHLTSCVAKEGLFKDYSPAECDRLRRKFRDAITQSSATAIGTGVDVEAWRRIAPGTALAQVPEPESGAFGICVRETLKIEALNRSGMAIYFDQGRHGQHIQATLDGAMQLLPEAAETSTFAFLEVGNCPALQAADTVANEFFRHLKKWMKDERMEPDPHLDSFIKNLNGCQLGFMGEAQITDLAQKMSDGP